MTTRPLSSAARSTTRTPRNPHDSHNNENNNSHDPLTIHNNNSWEDVDFDSSHNHETSRNINNQHSSSHSYSDNDDSVDEDNDEKSDEEDDEADDDSSQSLSDKSNTKNVKSRRSTSSKSTFLNDILDAWPQHLVAIFIAILATFLAHSQITKQKQSVSVLLSPNQNAVKHYHLESYLRTANITFCHPMSKQQQYNQQLQIGDSSNDNKDNYYNNKAINHHDDSLQLFDFNVPIDLLPALYLHYAADILQDDDYETVVFDNKNYNVDVNQLMQQSNEVACIVEQVSTTNKKYIVGYSYYYAKPTLDSMYLSRTKSTALAVKSTKQALQPALLTFTGFAAKFVNLSPKPVLLYWDGRSEKDRRLVGEIAPYATLGTATTPGQSFSVTPLYDSSHALERWVVTADDAVLYYNDYDNMENGREKLESEFKALSSSKQRQYQMHKLHQVFAKNYQIHAKRTWLANFPRAFPLYHMWSATHFDQIHTVVDKGDNDKEYALKVVSVTPRVFVINNFMTPLECKQLLELVRRRSGSSGGFSKSTVYSGTLAQPQRDLSTRSSSNAWLARQTTNLTDQLYRRAATILQIDQALMQPPDADNEDSPHVHSIAESLQIVRYRAGEEYTAHHDFVYPPPLKRHQPTRFATLLLYLNDDFEGGETVFPRAVNAQYHDGITIKPKQGQAVLFYNVLPDGNVDDLSQHQSLPVKGGTKYLANLWVWEPHIY